MSRAFRIHAADNVATMLADVASGEHVEILGQHGAAVAATEAVSLGHKIAMALISPGSPIVKFGVPIGYATREIVPGDWVHLHNVASAFDERSKTLDVQTGAVTDTEYE